MKTINPQKPFVRGFAKTANIPLISIFITEIQTYDNFFRKAACQVSKTGAKTVKNYIKGLILKKKIGYAKNTVTFIVKKTYQGKIIEKISLKTVKNITKNKRKIIQTAVKIKFYGLK